MKWVKIDHYTGKPIAHNSGWHIVDYVSGDFKIINDCGRYILTQNGNQINSFKTLKEAKAQAENV